MPDAANTSSRRLSCPQCGAELSPGADQCAACGFASLSERLDSSPGGIIALLGVIEEWRAAGLIDETNAQRLVAHYERELPAAAVDESATLGRPGPAWREQPGDVTGDTAGPLASEALAAPTVEDGALPTPTIPAGTPPDQPHATAAGEARPAGEPLAAAPPATTDVTPTTTPPSLPPALPSDGPLRQEAAPPPVRIAGRPRREPFSWSRIGMALLSERTMRALLYLGAALVVASTLTLTVRAFVAGWPLYYQQPLLIAGGVSFWLMGRYVRERLGLRLSGGVLMDLGALWIPLNVGVATYYIFGARPGSPYIIGIAIDAPLNWLIICAVTAPAFAVAALRYQLVLLTYASAILLGGAVVSAAYLAGIPWDWQFIAAAPVAPALVLTTASLRRRGVREIEPHLFWLAHGWVPAVLLILVALAIAPDSAPLNRFSLATLATIASVTYALLVRTDGTRSGPAQAYAAAMTLALAVLLALRDAAPGAVAWYALAPVVIAGSYMMLTTRARALLGALRSGSPRPGVAQWTEFTHPLTGTAFVLTLAGALYPWLTAASGAATYGLLAMVYAAGTVVYGRRALEYIAALLLVGAVTFALAAAEVAVEWHGVAFAVLSAAMITGGWLRREHAPGVLAAAGTRFPWLRAMGPPAVVGLGVAMLVAVLPGTSFAAAATSYALLTATSVAAAALYRRRLFEYGAALLMAVTLLLALEATALIERHWWSVSLAALALAYVGAGWWRADRAGVRRGLPPRHLIEWLRRLGPGGSVALPLTLAAGLMPALLTPPSDALAGSYVAAATYAMLAAVYALAAAIHRQIVFEYLAAGLAAAAVWLALSALDLPDAHVPLALAALGAAFIGGGTLLRGGIAIPRHLGPWGHLVTPYFIVGYSLMGAAVLQPVTAPGPSALALFIATAGVGGGAWIVRSRAPAYAAVLFIFAPFLLTLEHFGVGPHARGLALLALAGLELLAAEALLRRPSRESSARELLRRGADRGLAANPLLIGGLLALGAALAYATGDVIAVRGASLGPWTYVGAAVLLGLLAARWRCPAVVHGVVWLLVPALVLLGGRGYYLGWQLSTAEHALALGLLGAVYVVAGMAIARPAPAYGAPVLVAGYLLPVAAVVGSIPDRGVNAAVVALGAVIYGASAVAADRGWHRAFDETVARRFPSRDATTGAIARSAFQYPLALLIAIETLLLLSLLDPLAARYGLVLAALAIAYVATGRLLERRAAAYRYPWYVTGYAMSVIAPLTAWSDPSLRLVVFGASIVLYGGSALLSRRLPWVHLTVLLIPVWQMLLLDRLDLARSKYGAAAVGLALVYLLGGWAIERRGNLRSLRPIAGTIAPAALPFFIAAFLTSAIGLGFGAWQEPEVLVGTFAGGAALYVLAAAILSQGVLIYAAVALALFAYLAGIELIPGLDPGYEGLMLIPGAAVALASAEVARRFSRPAGIAWRDLLGQRLPAFDTAAMPLYLGALVLAVAIPLQSLVEPWPAAIAFGASAAILGALTWSVRGPLWVLPAVLMGELAYLQLLFASRIWETWPVAAALLVPVVAVLAVIAEVRWRRELRPSPAIPFDWWLPLHLAALGTLLVTLAVASVEAVPGCVAAAAYGAVIAGMAQHRASVFLAWAAIAAFILAAAQAARWAELSGEQIALLITISALLLRTAAELLGFARRAESNRARVLGAVWAAPIRIASIPLALVGPAAALALWIGAGLPQTGAQTLSWTLAISGLYVVLEAYAAREARLSYFGVALLGAAYALQLVHYNVREPLWFALPAGLYLLAIARGERYRGALAPAVVLEWSGVALLLAIPLLQAIGLLGGEYPVQTYRNVLFAESLLVVGLAALLHWKRPFFAGMVAFLANLILLLIEPARQVDQWVMFGLVGLLLISIGLAAERNRARVISTAAGLRARLDEWS